jgi:hypothetical protein
VLVFGYGSVGVADLALRLGTALLVFTVLLCGAWWNKLCFHCG